ncbi:hypothetical protein D3C71_1057240 [compost metagenome]
MPRARLERAFDHPDPMQLITGELRVEVARCEQLLVLHLRAADFVIVIGNVDLLLALELPVVAVWRAVEQVRIVRRAQAVG